MPETSKNIGGGESWPLLFWLSLIAIVLLSGCAPQSSRPAENQNTAAGGEQASRGGGELGHPVLGDPGAPVLMVEYGDFQ